MRELQERRNFQTPREKARPRGRARWRQVREAGRRAPGVIDPWERARRDSNPPRCARTIQPIIPRRILTVIRRVSPAGPKLGLIRIRTDARPFKRKRTCQKVLYLDEPQCGLHLFLRRSTFRGRVSGTPDLCRRTIARNTFNIRFESQQARLPLIERVNHDTDA